VPVETIAVPNPEIAGLAPAAYEIIGERVTHRLAQRPGSYVVLKYVRQVVKRKDVGTLSCPPTPAGVLEGGRADVSFLAGLLVDQFLYHLPLYRQHQRLLGAGIAVSRPWLTQQVLAVALLLAPIVAAQLAAIRACRVKAMDETPIKAGYKGPGKLKTGYFWPLWGDTDDGGGARSPCSTGPRVRRCMYVRGSGTGRGKARCCSATATAPMRLGKYSPPGLGRAYCRVWEGCRRPRTASWSTGPGNGEKPPQGALKAAE
jgi:transposase